MAGYKQLSFRVSNDLYRRFTKKLDEEGKQSGKLLAQLVEYYCEGSLPIGNEQPIKEEVEKLVEQKVEQATSKQKEMMGYKLVSESDDNNVVELESVTLIKAYREALATLGYRITHKKSTDKNPTPCWVEICMDMEDIGEIEPRLELDISPYLPSIEVETLKKVALHDHFEGGEWTDELAKSLEFCGNKDVVDFMDLVNKMNRFGGDKIYGFTLRVKSRKVLLSYLLKEEIDALEDKEYQELERLYHDH